MHGARRLSKEAIFSRQASQVLPTLQTLKLEPARDRRPYGRPLAGMTRRVTDPRRACSRTRSTASPRGGSALRPVQRARLPRAAAACPPRASRWAREVARGARSPPSGCCVWLGLAAAHGGGAGNSCTRRSHPARAAQGNLRRPEKGRSAGVAQSRQTARADLVSLTHGRTRERSGSLAVWLTISPRSIVPLSSKIARCLFALLQAPSEGCLDTCIGISPHLR